MEEKDTNQVFDNSRLDRMRFILVMFFLVEQRWGYIINKSLADDNITTKQWLMLILIEKGFTGPPSIQEVAGQLSTTHQNVKQIAVSMEKRGFITMERDAKDKRVIRLKMTDKCRQIFENRPQDVGNITSLFEGLSDDEVEALFHIIDKMEKTADKLYEKVKSE